jgi:argininosuccinate lyase
VTEGGRPSGLWGGRFEGIPAGEMDRLNRSLPVDHRIWREDLAGSVAWARELGEAGVVPEGVASELVAGLERVGSRLEGWGLGDWAAAHDEDIHSLVERLLFEEVGAAAGQLATGRSRNDQVATATRLWAMGAVASLDDQLGALQSALADQAASHVETLMPAYTHLQRAQPVTAAHWLLSHVWPLFRDRERLADSLERVSVMPLGSGAVAGCPFPVDRERLARALGFEAVSGNSMDAVADRDFVAELLFVLALVGVHLSRLAEDVVVFASSEFGYLRLPDRYATGSSLMPQKKNPDAMELARGKAGRLLGELTGWLATLKGLPSGYNKDLQEDKASLFTAFDILDAVLPAVTGTVRELTVDVAACAAGVDPAMLATDLADALVERGVPFRAAHEQVGRLVRLAETRGCPLDALPPDAVTGIAPALAGVSLGAILDARVSIARRAGTGGTAPVAVRDQLAAVAERLTGDRAVRLSRPGMVMRRRARASL